MENKHTPGPWIVATWGRKANSTIGITAGEAWVADAMGDHVNRGADEQELQANARLIAAAPDMLDVLQDIYMDAVIDGPTVTLNIDTINKVKSVIEKALNPQS